MIDAIVKGLTKIFGSKSERDIKELYPYVEQVNEAHQKLVSLSHDELRDQTYQIKAKIDAHLQEIDNEIQALHQEIDENPDLDIAEKETLFEKIDKLEESRNTELEKVLLTVLPEAFAIIKETARRFKENEEIRVKATELDQELAARRPDSIRIEDGYAVWKNRWMAGGSEVVWDMVHYDVQIIGGVVLHQGKIAEMATGEGKTLVATFPAFLNALAKRGVHIVTVNDYLAKRDSEWMGPLFEFHGLRVDCIDKHQPNSPQRRRAYTCDIIYGTNNEFGFDYLRDNMARDPQELVQKKHHFAMVDEVDSVLIDDARTPLIISGPIPRGDQQEFEILRPRVGTLFEEQKKLVGSFLVEARKKISEGDEKEGGLALFRAYRGLPKYKPLIKFLSEQGMRQILQKTENFYLQDNAKQMPEADQPLLFTIEEKNNTVDLTEKGIEHLTKANESTDFFILPDIGTEIAKIEKHTEYSDEEKLEAKEKLIQSYTEKTQRIHSVNQLLKAYALFERDVEYVIMDGKVKIVDEQTGRIMEGRRYSDGLHQAIEAKEGVKVEDATQTYATITLQNYFRMYHKLAGMTGTAETEAGEFWEIYKLDVVVIPTNKPIVRDDRDDKVYKTTREKFNAVVDEIVTLTEAGRPVLVGTTSVETSELLSRMLRVRKINHQVLNAKFHQREAEVVAEAGKPGTVTIATNMAGRGTDIKLTPESRAAGGLAIIGTERHESRRVDRQLRGRSGRQGDPGTSQFFVALDDNLMRIFGTDRIAKLMDRMGLEEGEVIQHSMVSKSIERAQKKVEENNFSIRKRLLEYDDVMNAQREVIYTRRRHALFGERLELDLMNAIYDISEDIAMYAKQSNDFEDLTLNIIRVFGINTSLTQDEFDSLSLNALTERLYEEAYAGYRRKQQGLTERVMGGLSRLYEEQGSVVENVGIPFTDGKKQLQVVVPLKKTIESEGKEMIRSMEKFVALAFIDMSWKEHLREMDDLKQSVQNASYEQKDPLLIYKFEALELFKRFISKLDEEVISFLTKADIAIDRPDQMPMPRPAMRPPRPAAPLHTNRTEPAAAPAPSNGAPAPMGARPQVSTNRPSAAPQAPAKAKKVADRNQRVSVRYADGRVKKDVKFKTVEQDLMQNRCVLIEA
ncbi:preprotein translocase subunit SecA [Catalinimonas alkaloidigena]|uniref:Protein translocase subunit SecA n=1 Tax=Catalinimonas alkaloidigena TaxID=1075417 RepID=A0A1G9DFL9_9BACT|nr:preprotein translocase subunit SecA [Catalinimonas alkaloidigena]SDK62642.1 preprotein translocase subunit SecA [Catalinimonas alkaloidigena]